MALSDTIGDLIGKYSVTGVLKERLELAAERADFETRKFEAERAGLTKQISDLSLQVADLSAKLSQMSLITKQLETQRDDLRRQLDAVTQIGPATELDMGAEITLAGLMNNPSGIIPAEIFRGIAWRATPNDIQCWIDEFREHGFVEVPAQT